MKLKELGKIWFQKNDVCIYMDLNGQWHNSDGPALMYPNKDQTWYVRGEYKKANWISRIRYET